MQLISFEKLRGFSDTIYFIQSSLALTIIISWKRCSVNKLPLNSLHLRINQSTLVVMLIPYFPVRRVFRRFSIANRAVAGSK